MTAFSGKTVLGTTYSHLLKITKNSNKVDEMIDFKALNIRQEKAMIPERWEPYAYGNSLPQESFQTVKRIG